MQAAEWNEPDKHQTTIVTDENDRALIERQLDGDAYLRHGSVAASGSTDRGKKSCAAVNIRLQRGLSLSSRFRTTNQPEACPMRSDNRCQHEKLATLLDAVAQRSSWPTVKTSEQLSSNDESSCRSTSLPFSVPEVCRLRKPG